MTQLYYIIHLLLNTKHKFLLYIIIYILILSIYHTLTNDIVVVECMKKASSNINLPSDSDKEYIQYLEEEAWSMDKRISELEEHTSRLETNITTLQAENKRLSDRITALESKETLHKAKAEEK